MTAPWRIASADRIRVRGAASRGARGRNTPRSSGRRPSRSPSPWPIDLRLAELHARPRSASTGACPACRETPAGASVIRLHRKVPGRDPRAGNENRCLRQGRGGRAPSFRAPRAVLCPPDQDGRAVGGEAPYGRDLRDDVPAPRAPQPACWTRRRISPRMAYLPWAVTNVRLATERKGSDL